MQGYKRRQREVFCSITRPVHVALKLAVINGLLVEVYTLVITSRILYPNHGLPVDYLLGLEEGLIRTVTPKPEWNRRGTT